LGHLNSKGMLLLKDLAHGIAFEEITQISSFITCIQTKIKIKTFPKGVSRQVQEKLELVHSDLYGPMKECSWGDARYLLLFTNVFSWKSFG
jgi:hypothetical protein